MEEKLIIFPPWSQRMLHYFTDKNKKVHLSYYEVTMTEIKSHWNSFAMCYYFYFRENHNFVWFWMKRWLIVHRCLNVCEYIKMADNRQHSLSFSLSSHRLTQCKRVVGTIFLTKFYHNNPHFLKNTTITNDVITLY